MGPEWSPEAVSEAPRFRQAKMVFGDGPGVRRGRQRPVSAKSGVPPASSILGSAAWRSHLNNKFVFS